MINKHYDNICTVADHFGIDAQIEKAVEEVQELLQALKEKRFAGEDGILEESADVYNMLDQICYLTHSEDYVQDIAERKMERTMQMIGKR